MREEGEEINKEGKRERDIFDQIPSPPPKITDIEKLKVRELSYMSYPYPASYAFLAGRQGGQLNPPYAASLAAIKEGHPVLASAVPLGGLGTANLASSHCYQLGLSSGDSLGLPTCHPCTSPGLTLYEHRPAFGLPTQRSKHPQGTHRTQPFTQLDH